MTPVRTTLMRLALALGLSLALWAFVSFSENPEERVTFPEVQLQAIGLGDELVLVDSNSLPTQLLPLVQITLSTDRQQLANLRPVDVRAVLDLTGLGPGEHLVPVNVQPTRSNVSFRTVADGVEPSVVPIRLEQISSRTVPIRVDLLGSLPFSFERGEPKISFGGEPITTVQAIGPLSRIERVEEARTVANIAQLRATYLGPLTLTAVDRGGVAIDGVRLDPGNVTVEIPINPVVGLKLVPVVPTIVGQPAPGYAVRNVTISPPLITLAGSSGPLDAIDVLETQPMSIEGASQTVVSIVALIFPDGTSAREGEPEQVQVTVQIAPIERPFQVELPVQVTTTGLGPGLNASLNPTVVTVQVSGSNAALADLANRPLAATVDLSGLEAGSYVLEVSLNLSPGITLNGAVPTVQVTLRPQVIPPTATVPVPTPGDTATPVPEPGQTPTPSDLNPPGQEPTVSPEPVPTTESTPTP
ncbi:hypothetical protein EYB53_011905 [Candidatus Chloroploca sp. M-50]|uniref:YbbR-like domain-containing protein n=1 Tax=Candidatus Chloroploca mongolica TaxID=2528176 RepID=A0ABS4DAE1_9CHLR|nr:CdaR family protein [Candidatus Chloroploca mongolica]MBP1466408.1 hypothetical protein [Candidatus Chloroploca mongolica]